MSLDDTHDPRRQSWVASANGHLDFPIQNLPLGFFSPAGETERRLGVAIGDYIFDVSEAVEAGLLAGDANAAAQAAADGALNALFALGREPMQALRRALVDLLAANGPQQAHVEKLSDRLLHEAAACTLHLPARIGDYTDFYVGIHHATNVGKLMRPDNPLLPNYKHVPIGYHGRASSIVPSGTPVRRPNGQRKPAADPEPSFGPSRNLDFELELGIWIGEGNALGEPIPLARAAEHVAGFCLLNDWSARDIQGWEYQPLGPFLAKNFASTISPWVVTADALAPFRTPMPPRPDGDPQPMAYLDDPADRQAGGYDIALEALLMTVGLREKGLPPHRLALSSSRHMYWSVAQLVAHHTVNGCNLQPGDLLGSGTLSAPDEGGLGSLLEITQGGRRPLQLASGEQRRFLEDGDEITLRARARREGLATIGFGECRGRITPAPAI